MCWEYYESKMEEEIKRRQMQLKKQRLARKSLQLERPRARQMVPVAVK